MIFALKIIWLHYVTYGDAIVGFGTLALAGLTAYLGWETRKSAHAATEAVEASEEPFVIATPTDNWQAMELRHWESPVSGTMPPFEIHRAPNDEGDELFVRLKLWNIGLGPTIVEDIRLDSGDAELLGDLAQFYTLGAGHAADIEVSSLNQWPTSGTGTLTIKYRHASGRPYETKSTVEIEHQIVTDIVRCLTYRRRRIDEAGKHQGLWRRRTQERKGR
jgi:hypothetical protein